MRPPYTHLASPITMTASSSPATAGASSVASAMPRGGVALGLPAHPRGAQTPMGYTGFVPPPPLAHQFNPMHRGPDQPPPPAPQLRQPAPGIQNIGMIGSLSTSQMRSVAVSGPQQPRPGLSSSAAPSGSQMPGSQPRPGAISGPQQPRPGAFSGPQQPRPGAISGQQQPRPGVISGPQQPRPGAISGPQQPRPGLLSSATPSSSGSQMPGSQQTPSNVSSQFRPQQRPQVPQPRPYNVAQSAPVASHQQNVLSGQQQHLPQQQLLQQQQPQVPQQQLLQQQQVPQQQLLQQQQQQQQHQSQAQSSSQQNQQNTTLKNQQQAARTPVSLTQKPDTPATVQANNMQLLDMTSADAAASESSNRLLSKRSIHDLLAQVCCNS
ncbi:proline-rich proteoglycan 2-like isoform X2 [Lolium rigidum]|uniref:proline-rich proteoglycan 2-like isoform X2 n=1 Tax=Lolium rigidum TaxID=89674 RepID=UPI001F5C4CC9|nr:proline-rich proteoglycan 2-like isoform X2 [Lolium rigidum]